MDTPNYIATRDLSASQIPGIAASRLDRGWPVGPHVQAWLEIGRFATSYDLTPDELAEAPAWDGALDALDTRTLRQLLCVEWSVIRERNRGHDFGDSRAKRIDSLLDALYRRLSGGKHRAATVPPMDESIGLRGNELGSGQHRFWFVAKDDLSREQIYDRIAGLFLANVRRGFIVSALYLYEPAAVDGQLGHTVMVLLEARRGCTTTLEALNLEYERLLALAIQQVADTSRPHYPEAEELFLHDDSRV